jgi:hypothetical protein
MQICRAHINHAAMWAQHIQILNHATMSRKNYKNRRIYFLFPTWPQTRNTICGTELHCQLRPQAPSERHICSNNPTKPKLRRSGIVLLRTRAGISPLDKPGTQNQQVPFSSWLLKFPPEIPFSSPPFEFLSQPKITILVRPMLRQEHGAHQYLDSHRIGSACQGKKCATEKSPNHWRLVRGARPSRSHPSASRRRNAVQNRPL